MSWIKEDDLKAIRNRADIVDILSRYITLNKKGKSYTAICPFHDDHDPSLSISTDKQIYKCFVCGAGGDVFGFVSRIESISFPEAVFKVADIIGYPLDASISKLSSKKDENQPYYDILQAYIVFTQYELKSEQGIRAYDYLRTRKMNEDIIQRFEIGFAPTSMQSLRFLEAKRYSQDDLEKLGLVQDDHAVFQDRIMIPIHDQYGHPIGFTARILDSSSQAKYINTSQTFLFEKGNVIFNYHRASRFARKNGRCILVEGAMDVLAFEKADIHESMACLGTACTSYQLQLIKNLHVPVILCYDGDRAGQNATYKFIQKALQEHVEMAIVKNTSDRDPDEIYDAGGAQELQSFVSRTISVVDFLFDYLLLEYNLENYEDKKAYASELYEVIHATCSDFEKASYLHRIQTLTGFDFSQVKEEVPIRKRSKKTRPMLPLSRPLSGRYHAEREALMNILISKDASATFKAEVGFFQDPKCQQLSLYCYDIYRQQDQLDIDTLLARINEEEIRRFLLDLWEDTNRLQNYDETYFQDVLLKLKTCTLQEQIDQINRSIETVADPIEKAHLATKKTKLLMQQKLLRTKGG